MEVIKYMRVLVYLNPLVVNKISKKFLYEKDSGFLYTKQLISSLPPDWKFTILTPKGVPQEFFPNCTLVEYDYSTSIHQNRYHFNRNILAKALPYGKDIDLVLNMQPEVSANLRVFFENQRREKPIIVNYFHWIDCKESRKFASQLGGFISRQIEGINSADLSLFHNEYAMGLLEQSRVENGYPAVDYSSGFFHPAPTKFGCDPFKLPDKKIILFNHRLNNTTGWKQVVNICKKLKRDDFVLWLTDDQNLKEVWLNDEDYIIVQNVSFEHYGYLLQHAHFSVANLQGYATWNMSVIDSMYHGTSVVSTESDLMRSFNVESSDSIEDLIVSYLNKPKQSPSKLDIIDFPLATWVTEEIKSRVGKTVPKKYNDVIELIPCEKRTYVNKLWSFHANSNFQKIRWRLLLDGYVDTLGEYTFYHNI